jgi:hypothetical protein
MTPDSPDKLTWLWELGFASEVGNLQNMRWILVTIATVPARALPCISNVRLSLCRLCWSRVVVRLRLRQRRRWCSAIRCSRRGSRILRANSAKLNCGQVAEPLNIKAWSNRLIPMLLLAVNWGDWAPYGNVEALRPDRFKAFVRDASMRDARELCLGNDGC